MNSVVDTTVEEGILPLLCFLFPPPIVFLLYSFIISLLFIKKNVPESFRFFLYSITCKRLRVCGGRGGGVVCGGRD